MLTTYLNNSPYSKFVFIQDTVQQQGKNILKYIVDSHTKVQNCKIHYYVFEGNFESAKKVFEHPSIDCYDFVSDSRGWLDSNKTRDFPSTILELNKSGCVIVIDSLVHAIYQYGVVTIYKTLQQLLVNKDGLVRIVTILHGDLCENVHQTSQYFHHLATLALILEPAFNSDSSRVLYTYKKPAGKPIKQIEEYKFENGILKSQPIKKIDPKVLVQENLKQVQPENLTTFRIGLNQTEKESRAKLVLPYLPKEDELEVAGDNKEGDSKIFYQFDNMDDWDEEDPDDDLDI